jgi:copper chaperone CopZ
MKKIFYSALFLLLACNMASAQFIKAELQAAGLTCSMCSKATDKQLRTLDFIEKIDVDLGHTSFILYFKKDKTVNFDQIKKKVEDAGFSVAVLKPVYKFDNLKIGNASSFSYQNMVFNFMDTKAQTLNGEVTFRIIDKGFVSDKEYKKYSTLLTPSSNSGAAKGANTDRVYHVIL